jgi:hypothetical protein
LPANDDDLLYLSFTEELDSCDSPATNLRPQKWFFSGALWAALVLSPPFLPSSS